MAWTDTCKMEVVAQIKKRQEICGGVRPAIREISKESGIPYHTLQKWYHPRNDESVAENGYTPKAEKKKQTCASYNLHTLTSDSDHKKIMFGVGETGGNRCLVIQEFKVGRNGKETLTKNLLILPVDLIPQFRSALDQVEVLIQERCLGEFGAVGPNLKEKEPIAGDDTGDTQDDGQDDMEIEKGPSPSHVDDNPDEAGLIRCKGCRRYAPGLQLKDREMNGSCKSQALSWDGDLFQSPHNLHPCKNFFGYDQQRG